MPLASGTLAYYKLQGNLIDETGNYSGTLLGTLAYPSTPTPLVGTTWAQMNNPQLTAVASVDGAQFPNAAVPTNNGTVEFAFVTGANVTADQEPMVIGSSLMPRALGFHIYNGLFYIIGNDDSTYSGPTFFDTYAEAVAISANTAYYGAVTYATGSVKFYFGTMAGAISLIKDTAKTLNFASLNSVKAFQSYNGLGNFLGKMNAIRFSSVVKTSFPTADIASASTFSVDYFRHRGRR